jgi:hypothetical protein
MSPRTKRPQSEHGWYVYGIVENDLEILPDTRGVGDPPASVELVVSGDVAALVSQVDLDAPIGSRSDLLAHESLLDATAMDVPVLPLRFGAVVSSRDAVAHELLEPNRDEFAETLRQLGDEVQYVVRARYVEEALIREILDENPDVADLAQQVSGQPVESTMDAQLKLGEAVNAATESKRAADTDAVIDTVAPLAEATAVRPPTHEQDAAHVALLVGRDRDAELEEALRDLARVWSGRATVRLLGPMAPYDFVSTMQE